MGSDPSLEPFNQVTGSDRIPGPAEGGITLIQSPPGAMLYTNATIITMNRRREILSDGALLVDGTRIGAVGKTAELARRFPDEQAFDCQGGIMLPGLVDTHVHMAQTMLRGISEGRPLAGFGQWLFGRIFPLQGSYQPGDARASAALCLLEMIKSGTTAFVECLLAEHYGLDQLARLCLDSGIRAALGNVVMDVSPQTRDATGWHPGMWQTRESGIEATIAGHRRWTDEDGRLQIWFGCRSLEPANDLSLFPEVSELSQAHDIGLTIHLAEQESDNDYARSLGHRSHVELAHSLGLLGPRTILAHCTAADEEDIVLLAETGTTVAHCPANNSATGWGPARIDEMLDAGVNVTLGCDGAPTNANMDLLRDLRIACHVTRMRRHSRQALSPERVLEMATRNGAKALGLEGKTGSLEPGMKADFIVIDVDAPHLQPVWNPVATVVFAAQGADVDTVVVDGRELMSRREVKSLDEESILADVRTRHLDVAARAGVDGLGSEWPLL